MEVANKSASVAQSVELFAVCFIYKTGKTKGSQVRTLSGAYFNFIYYKIKKLIIYYIKIT